MNQLVIICKKSALQYPYVDWNAYHFCNSKSPPANRNVILDVNIQLICRGLIDVKIDQTYREIIIVWPIAHQLSHLYHE